MDVRQLARVSSISFSVPSRLNAQLAVAGASPTVPRFNERRANSSSNRARLLVMTRTLCPQVTDAAPFLRIAAGSDVNGGVLVIVDQANNSSCCLLDSIQRGHQQFGVSAMQADVLAAQSLCVHSVSFTNNKRHGTPPLCWPPETESRSSSCCQSCNDETWPIH